MESTESESKDRLFVTALARGLAFFAPDIERLEFPAWDCLPYDRASPALRATSDRLAALHARHVATYRPQEFTRALRALAGVVVHRDK